MKTNHFLEIEKKIQPFKKKVIPFVNHGDEKKKRQLKREQKLLGPKPKRGRPAKSKTGKKSPVGLDVVKTKRPTKRKGFRNRNSINTQ